MAKDPYQYYRVEARELLDGLGRGVLEIEKSGAAFDSAAFARPCGCCQLNNRFAHTFQARRQRRLPKMESGTK